MAAMATHPDPRPASPVRLVVAISSRALFDLAESHQVFENEGVAAYYEYQAAHEEDILEPGVAFPLARKLLALNEWLGERGRVDVILLSRNSSDTGLRVFNSIRHHGLDISRAAFAGGATPYRYVAAFGAHLFLSADRGRACYQGMKEFMKPMGRLMLRFRFPMSLLILPVVWVMTRTD